MAPMGCSAQGDPSSWTTAGHVAPALPTRLVWDDASQAASRVVDWLHERGFKFGLYTSRQRTSTASATAPCPARATTARPWCCQWGWIMSLRLGGDIKGLAGQAAHGLEVAAAMSVGPADVPRGRHDYFFLARARERRRPWVLPGPHGQLEQALVAGVPRRPGGPGGEQPERLGAHGVLTAAPAAPAAHYPAMTTTSTGPSLPWPGARRCSRTDWTMTPVMQRRC